LTGPLNRRRKSPRRYAATPFSKVGEEFLPPLKKGAANAVSGGFAPAEHRQDPYRFMGGSRPLLAAYRRVCRVASCAKPLAMTCETEVISSGRRRALGTR